MKPKICFVVLGSYPLFTSNEKLRYIGGSEKKQVLIAEELARKGYDITFITYDEEGDKKEIYKDISIIKSFSPSQNLNILTKAKMLWNSLKKSNAEIYIQSGGTPGIIPIFCLVHRKKYIKWLSSDKIVLLESVHRKTTLITKISLYIDIKFASLIVAQNEFQKKIVTDKFKKNCVLIKNPISIPETSIKMKDMQMEKIVLWIGTIGSIKQPEVYLKIARMLQNYKFRMIGGRSDSEPELYDIIRDEAKKISNLEFLGFVPYEKMQGYYEESAILLNTSKAEGFPNTFLEAWSNYIPVISLNIDPDNVLSKNNLGYHSKTFNQMVLDIESLLNNNSLRYEMGMNAKKYVKENHDVEKITDQFITMLTSLRA